MGCSEGESVVSIIMIPYPNITKSYIMSNVDVRHAVALSKDHFCAVFIQLVKKSTIAWANIGPHMASNPGKFPANTVASTVSHTESSANSSPSKSLSEGGGVEAVEAA